MPLSFSQTLVLWQRQAGRHDLPWQQSRDPYRIWLSEIMLQQTQVSTVLPYFARFLARFPDVARLAAASPDEVLGLWAGLGYYARARNLHAAARRVATEFGGRFPETAAQLAELPGVGRSTAAAIAAFAFGERAAILDGNAKRVLCRHFGIEGVPVGCVERSLWQLAESLLPAETSAMPAYTQALMDLGATCCTRKTPNCADCPLAASCVARREGKTDRLPTPKTPTPKPERSEIFLLLADGERVYLQQRPARGIWGGLYSLPEGEAWLDRLEYAPIERRKLPMREQAFTHFRLKIYPLLCRFSSLPPRPAADWHALRFAEAKTLGLPAPIARLLAEAKVLLEEEMSGS